MIMFTQLFTLFALVSTITRVASAQEPVRQMMSEQSERSEPIASQMNDDESIKSGGINEQIFKQYFVKRRKEHLDVVKNLRRMENYEQRYKMVSMLAENSLSIIGLNQEIIEGVNISFGNGEEFKNSTVRLALTTILETCALFGDVILQLPDITRRVLKDQKNWNATLRWGLNFVNETRHLVDDPTVAMFDLVRQELKIVPRHPNYTNKFWPKNIANPTNDKTKKKDKKSKKNRGPRMVNIEL
ncbi:coiled-coil domain-containing protein 134-like [Venturia canescens]|uniref:coiled-coil domain-containing protein 134-like n=1 Tax=Venturia canescens TaxID=32260 RepID=UPI001C9CDFBA|nr:coiled-coil domain-containing protein 134-like [Venturia canescens]XP_043278526.1 coiled-coil domain-containing protein 134-like [Venturia canescens]